MDIGNSWNANDLQIHEDGSIYSIANYTPSFSTPRHLIRKLTKDFELEWYKDYLNPPFHFFEFGQPGVYSYNLSQIMFPDHRGGYYVVGDLFGPSEYFGYNTDSPNKFLSGASLLKIDEEGMMAWAYIDSFSYVFPHAAGQLSSGSLVVLESAYEFIDGSWRDVVSMIKTDEDACEVPGCRTVATNDPDENQVVPLKLRPNPVYETLEIENESNLDFISIEILDINSQRIINQIYCNHIDVSILPSGIYFLKLLKEDGKSWVQKFVKL